MPNGAPPHWRSLIRWLKRKCPLSLPVKVSIVSKLTIGGERVDGVAWQTYDGARYWIRVRAELNDSEMYATLYHEWAHLMQYDRMNWHDDLWAKCHGETYRAYEEWLKED